MAAPRQAAARWTAWPPPPASWPANDPSDLAPAFALGAAALQQIRRDPLLPPELAGEDWPGVALRAAYQRYRAAFSAAVAAWFEQAGPP